jgi:RNA polymerase sigma-70 factor (ECF subfamily)
MATADESFKAGGAAGQISFDRIYDQYFSFVYRSARRLGVPLSAVDDAVQEVFVVLHRRIPEYDGRASLQSWIYGILANVVRDYRRAFRRKQAKLLPAANDELLGPAPSATDPERRAELQRDVELLLELLDELPDAQRELLVLAELEQMSIPEICACLGGNPNTVYSRLRAARENLRIKLSRRLLVTPRETP